MNASVLSTGRRIPFPTVGFLLEGQRPHEGLGLISRILNKGLNQDVLTTIRFHDGDKERPRGTTEAHLPGENEARNWENI